MTKNDFFKHSLTTNKLKKQYQNLRFDLSDIFKLNSAQTNKNLE